MTFDEPQQRVWRTENWADAGPSLPALDPALMRLLLQNIATRVAVVGADRCYRYANAETLKFMGLTADQVIGRHMSQVLDAGVYEAIRPLFDRAFAGEQLRRSAWADYSRQGRRFREQWYVPYRRSDGADVEAVVVCGLDHTEQRLGEQELAEQRTRLRTSEALKAAIVDHALTAFVSTDADGRIVEFNPSAEAMFGRSRASVLGLLVSDVMIPQRFRDAHERGMQRMRLGHASTVLGRRLEMHALRKDGGGEGGNDGGGSSEFPMEMVLWRTDVEGAAFYTASISDLSERHAAAQQIERQREALRQSEKLTAMGSLLAGVSHELNNPLAIVMGRASLLEEKCSGDAALQHDARRIREAAERCGRIVRTFLNMARSRPARRAAVDLADAVRASTDMLGYTYRSHDIALQTALDPALPQVDADIDQICQILLNLLVNAQQALLLVGSPRRVSISAGTEAAGRAVWLRVADNGPGVPAAAQARLFEPFFTTKGEGLGTGMGLAVSRTLARAHGGDLVLEAGAVGAAVGADVGAGAGAGGGPGAVFRLTLALGTLADASAAASDAAAAPVASEAAATRILVVDDEADLANVMREMLESAGHEVASAESGAVALELLQAGRFDAVVCDLRMSDMDGAGLWRAIGASQPGLLRRLLFITGDTLSADAASFFAESACACLEKPFTRSQLLEAVAGLVAGSAPAAGA